MLQTVEAEIDVNGKVELLEPVRVTKRTRAIVTLLEEKTEEEPERKGNSKEILEFLRKPNLLNRKSRRPRKSKRKLEERGIVGLKPIYVYLDSCFVIYLVEEHPTFAPLLENYIANAPDLIFVILRFNRNGMFGNAVSQK